MVRLQILQLASECQLLVKLVFSLCHADVCLYHTARAFYHCLVVALVHIHKIEFERLSQLFLHLYVDVLIVYSTHVEESHLVALGSHHGVAKLAFGICSRQWFLSQAPDVAYVEFQLCAVFSSERCVALEVVGSLSLESPFSVCRLCGVWIEGSQSVSVLVGKGWHIVDEAGYAARCPVGAESHVLAAFCL